MQLNSNITDTALILEGGGMRNSYTSGIATVLLQEKIYFNFVSGISAGSSLGVNYLTRDIKRMRKSFVDIATDPKLGGIISFLKGNGFFNSDYLYGKICEKNQFLELDYNAFQNNEATFMVGAVNALSGELEYFSNKDMHTMENLLTIVRASSTMPFLMPITSFEDNLFYDGGIAGGIPLDIAKQQGYKKFFILLTRPRGYIKTPPKRPALLRMSLRKYPKVFNAIMNRAEIYNKTIKEIEQLEKNGQAFVVYAEDMNIENTELKIHKLKETFDNGYKQASRDISTYKEFLGI